MPADERHEIEAAMDRLLNGTPLRSEGKLTIVSLAAEAGVKRHALTHKHTDLKDLFNTRVKAQHSIPASETALREQNAELRGSGKAGQPGTPSRRSRSASLPARLESGNSTPRGSRPCAALSRRP